MHVAESFIWDLFDRLMYESCHLTRINGYQTLGVREMKTATILCLGHGATQSELSKVSYTYPLC